MQTFVIGMMVMTLAAVAIAVPPASAECVDVGEKTIDGNDCIYAADCTLKGVSWTVCYWIKPCPVGAPPCTS